MRREPAIAVIDIGKSNGKLALIDLTSRLVIAIRTTANVVVEDGPYPHFDVERMWRWLIEGLSGLSARAEITTIAVTTHGACFVLLDGDALALPVLDYEHAGPEEVRAEYRTVRGDFQETLSPELPNGLNAGRQLYWLSRTFPAEFAHSDAILPYPQYWVWRLSGEKVSEATSLGCHTDLWAPRTGTYSQLAVRQGWDQLFPGLVKPWDDVGRLLPDVAKAAEVSPECRVVAGIHDSNASLLPHLLARQPPFAVLASGTWMVVLAVGGKLDRLDPRRDCLANVDAFGRPVPSARFMAGREFEIIAGGESEASKDDVAEVVRNGVMALPTFAPGTGPFGRGDGHWSVDNMRLGGGERAAAASLYAALVTQTCLELAGAEGPTIVEGPFARNKSFLAALAQLIGRPVVARSNATGTTDGAALLALGPDAEPAGEPDAPPVVPLDIDLTAYVSAWREKASSA